MASKFRLFIEQDPATKEWVVYEWSRGNEYTRGRYATEAEAAIRMTELQPARSFNQLIVEEITERPPWPRFPTPPKKLTHVFNVPEKMWLVLGGRNDHELQVIDRFPTEFEAKRHIRRLRRGIVPLR